MQPENEFPLGPQSDRCVFKRNTELIVRIEQRERVCYSLSSLFLSLFPLYLFRLSSSPFVRIDGFTNASRLPSHSIPKLLLDNFSASLRIISSLRKISSPASLSLYLSLSHTHTYTAAFERNELSENGNEQNGYGSLRDKCSLYVPLLDP